MSMPGMSAMPLPMSMPAMPMSAIVRTGLGPSSGTGALMPSSGASVPRAYPIRAMVGTKIVYALASLGCTITS